MSEVLGIGGQVMTDKPRMADADKLINSMKKGYCKPCKDVGDDFEGTMCRSCIIGDLINYVDDYATMKEKENE